jgi:hypothetical protein
MPSYGHSGDLGDAIFALPSVRALGGGEIYFFSRPWTRTRWSPRVLSVIKPLIDETGYAGAALHDGEWIDYDFSTFRHGGYKLGDTIMERQRRWVGAERWDGKPWLQAEPNKVAPIVINRASRWQAWDFPWRQVIETFYDDLIFIGLQSEHEVFQKEFGKVFFVPCEDLLEAAQIIAGADLFLGNQSACNAIANGLGKKIILEVCPYGPDCFLGNKTFYSFNGEAEVEARGRKLIVPPRSSGRFSTIVGTRQLFADDPDKLRVLARGVHAFHGTFAFYDDVEVLH